MERRSAAWSMAVRPGFRSVLRISSASSIGGVPAIYVYQAGQYFGRDERGNPVSSYSHAYSLYFNDGINFLRVSVSFADDLSLIHI